jgi:hypothetical protein
VRRVFGAAPRTGAGTGACCVPPQADKHGLSLYWWARHLWPHFVEPPEPEYPLVLDKETALRFRTETACSSSSSSSGGGGV